MGIFGKQCQSCGMPLSKDKLGGGTEANSTKNTDYCSHCYIGGQFTEPNLTADLMVQKVKEKMRSMGFPAFLAALLARQIPKLKRWK